MGESLFCHRQLLMTTAARPPNMRSLHQGASPHRRWMHQRVGVPVRDPQHPPRVGIRLPDPATAGATSQNIPKCSVPKRDQPAFTSSPAEPRPCRCEQPAGADPVIGLRAEKFGPGIEDDGGTTRPTGERTSPADSSPEADPQHSAGSRIQIRAFAVHICFSILLVGLPCALRQDRNQPGCLCSVQPSPDATRSTILVSKASRCSPWTSSAHPP
ncbi:uncharacterized protein LOC127417156 [Myxocyprinus asiaticus]|uniref:uncharacterized protein LOC127417156 n=1 Tax=Myxocyprinus asiaticus TaxID=70543 RepID=UPI0022237C6C|nr:uncharacterized protein LOC127417156 [Myxocyprinus asiaticus]